MLSTAKAAVSWSIPTLARQFLDQSFRPWTRKTGKVNRGGHSEVESQIFVQMSP
jgi:hypothetical protein